MRGRRRRSGRGRCGPRSDRPGAGCRSDPGAFGCPRGTDPRARSFQGILTTTKHSAASIWPAALLRRAAAGAAALLFFSRIHGMGWHVVDGSKAAWSEREALFEGQPPRHYVEVTDEAALKNSRARLSRYPPGTRGRRHADKVQAEVFV